MLAYGCVVLTAGARWPEFKKDEKAVAPTPSTTGISTRKKVKEQGQELLTGEL